MEPTQSSKSMDIGPMKFLPIMAIVILGYALFMMDTTKYETQPEDNSAMMAAFLVISLAVFYLIRKNIEPAKTDIRKVLPVLIFTEIPAVLGFALAFVQMDKFYFYVFALISLAYYAYVYKKLFSVNNSS